VTPAERSKRAQLASLTRWAADPDWSSSTAPARAGFEARFDRAVINKHGVLPPEEHAKYAAIERRLYFAGLQAKAAKARRARKAI
jgi:hypothetical protein